MDQAASRPSSAVSRRNILIGLGGAAIAAVVAAPMWQPSASQRARRLLSSNAFTRRFISLAHAEQAEWTAQVGSVFTIEGGYRMRLAGVEPLNSKGDRPADVTRERAFVAVFDVLGGMTMPGNLIYSVRHGQYGQMPIFLTVASDTGRMLAVFN